MASNLQNNAGLFLATTNVWDVQSLPSIDVNSAEFKELIVRLYQNINNICLAVNLKDSGYYVESEFVNGQVLFGDRQIFRTVVNFGALPNATFKSIPHGIVVSNGFSFTRIYATASDQITMQYIPIPYASATLVNNIELDVDANNVTITTGIDMTAYTITYVVLEYVKI